MVARTQKNTTSRGLGWSHQKTRDGLLRAHRNCEGAPCWWCGRPMFTARQRNWDYSPTSLDPNSGTLAADHSQARAQGGTKADRLLHGLCNKQRGDGSRDHLRPAVTNQLPEPDADPATAHLGHRAMSWP